MHQIETIEILNLLIAAGKEILNVYNSGDIGEESKADLSPVTKADKASSRLINNRLNELFPEIPVLDEENQIPPFEERKKWKQFFLLDPLDGTREFIRKNGEFCINLAFLENNVPVQGWIYHPLTGKGLYCQRGSGVMEFDQSLEPIPVDTENRNQDKLVIVASRSFFNDREAILVDSAKQKFNAELHFLGSALKQIQITKNQADLYLKASSSSEWDTAPGQLMIEESGGTVLRFEDFKKPEYNKPSMENPDFLMVGKRYNHPEFIHSLKKIIALASDQPHKP